MADEEANQNLIRIKVGATGVDVSAGRSLPELLARLLPSKFRIRRSVNEAITGRILEKIRSNTDFDEAEVAFAEEVLSEQAQKYIRLKHVQQRAYSLFSEAPPVPLIEPGDTPISTAPQTSDDWVNKFREDASLVDDDLVREIYARVLAEEARYPTSFSLRTLRVLRYLDREAATAFGQLQKVVLNDAFVPQQSNDKNHVLQAVGLNHATMLLLEDAGLVYASTQSEYSLDDEVLHFIASGHSRALAARRIDSKKMAATISVHLLTPAGMELASIAECEPDEPAFMAFVNWLRTKIEDAIFQVATLPSKDWSGQFSELTWQPIDPNSTAQESGQQSP
jgi:Protein of unknown function (DUF2806)